MNLGVERREIRRIEESSKEYRRWKGEKEGSTKAEGRHPRSYPLLLQESTNSRGDIAFGGSGDLRGDRGRITKGNR